MRAALFTTISHSKVIFIDWSEELRTSRVVQIQDWLSPEAGRSVAQHRGRWAVKSDFVEGLGNRASWVPVAACTDQQTRKRPSASFVLD